MELSRRSFLKLTGAGAGTAVLVSLSKGTSVFAAEKKYVLKRGVETTTICCYCSVGCGALITVYEDGILKVDGDPDHPINQGTLCPKGLAMAQIGQVSGKANRHRITEPMYRRKGSTEWEYPTWDWMIATIAARAKAARDAALSEDGNEAFNRCETVAHLGGGELDNEECYALSKFNRAFGVTYIEHCARL